MRKNCRLSEKVNVPFVVPPGARFLLVAHKHGRRFEYHFTSLRGVLACALHLSEHGYLVMHYPV